ncbi:PR domain zinc finger protein 4 [Halyomorpha halys]|uniref:PR domain zinc finger protein 4 n=1 Tax=Halyomorpha halys TaxID=286706 RepID=UPI0006D52342|nr:PR domain zinc finger protein 4 [Halyomorpha halys]
MLTIYEPKVQTTLVNHVNDVKERNIGAVYIADKYDTKLNDKDEYSENIETTSKAEKLDTGNVIKHINEITDDNLSNFSSKIVSSLKEYIGNKLCKYCDGPHSHASCPLNYSSKFIFDSISLEDWKGGEGFAIASLPSKLELKDGKIFTLVTIPFNTQFGPLVGVTIKEVEISDDSGMNHIWELSEGKYVCTEDLSQSNWMRWVSPAPTRNQRNLVALSKNGSLYFIALKLLEIGDELLYWAEPSTPWASKNMEKTNCGGCNLKFASPMDYRLHCYVFHDPTLSLSVRKYHCKVCAEPIFGKQNIINHALSAHDGKGAYQCQFCSKFFLRLNYLEMHRNYGCSSNPHRSRPLCHHCGKKFCQPQKLKVHIKRMHSELPETLKEFQCSSCMKLLGSHAALQRHSKQVHKQMPGLPCPRCGKEFRNTSNLKIHMLTHSGVKPYRCRKKNCSSAFTTKQCLQLHYKKVHGLSDCELPGIERSVEYTFDAYSGEGSNYSDLDSVKPKVVEDMVPVVHVHVPQTSIVSKGSRKWMGDLPTEDSKKRIEEPKLFPRNGSASASLLVEAAIESAEKDIGSTYFPYFSPSRYMGVDCSSSLEGVGNLSKKNENCDSYVGNCIYQDHNAHLLTNYSSFL